MDLTDDEREIMIRLLRAEALAKCRELGCTCQPEPHMALTPYGIGPYNLPGWLSQHDKPCLMSDLKNLIGKPGVIPLEHDDQ